MDGLTVETKVSEEVKTQLREKQNELISIIEALTRLDTNPDWQTLKELVFDRALDSIERQIRNEALNQTIDTSKIYKLQGEWAWAKQNVDSDRFISTLKIQLEDIKQKLK